MSYNLPENGYIFCHVTVVYITADDLDPKFKRGDGRITTFCLIHGRCLIQGQANTNQRQIAILDLQFQGKHREFGVNIAQIESKHLT